MDILEHFMAYAGDFERTLADDDWSRLEGYFCDDAVYVIEGSALACRLEGRDAIFAGIKKSLDGLDRRFDGRDIEITSGPVVDGDEMRVAWTLTYKKPGVEPLRMRGETLARYRDDRIAYLADSYDGKLDAEVAAWSERNSFPVDPSYV